MKLIAQIEGEQKDVNIKKDGEFLFAEIDGREYRLEVSEPEPNVYLLKNDGEIHEIFVSPNETSDEPLKVKTKTQDFEINLIDPKRLSGSGAGGGSADGIAEIKTAMPGKVVRVLVEVGDEVKNDQGIIVVEAMKMQNEMKSPKDGVIKEIYFNEGDTVNAGDILVIIE